MVLYSHSKEYDRSKAEKEKTMKTFYFDNFDDFEESGVAGEYEGRKDRGMKEYKRIKNVYLIWTEEFDIIKEWDDNGHIIKQEIANYQRYRTIS